MTNLKVGDRVKLSEEGIKKFISLKYRKGIVSRLSYLTNVIYIKRDNLKSETQFHISFWEKEEND